MRRLAVTVEEDDVETVLDRLLPKLPAGVYPRELPGSVELSWRGEVGRDELEPLIGEWVSDWTDEEVPDEDFKRRFGNTWVIADRLVVRAPDGPPGPEGLPEVLIEPIPGAFGSGAHPTTQGSLELLMRVEPAGTFADLGCGAGVLAIVAARLGYEVVFAIDHDAGALKAAVANAERNGVGLSAAQVDLTTTPPPPADVIAANVPLVVHREMAPNVPDTVRVLIASGLEPGEEEVARKLYGDKGFKEVAGVESRGWTSLLLMRGDG